MSQPNPHLAERAQKAAKIIADPAAFKICESCESIVAARVTMCPNCNGYRFDEDTEAVVAQATLLGNREQTSVREEDME